MELDGQSGLKLLESRCLIADGQHAEHDVARKTRLEEIHRIPEESARAAANAGVPATATGAAAGTGAVAGNRAENVGHSGVGAGPNTATATGTEQGVGHTGVPTGAQTEASGVQGVQGGQAQQGFVPEGGMPQGAFQTGTGATGTQRAL